MSVYALGRGAARIRAVKRRHLLDRLAFRPEPSDAGVWPRADYYPPVNAATRSACVPRYRFESTGRAHPAG